jgi:uncharacterized protein (TIGR03067 family)
MRLLITSLFCLCSATQHGTHAAPGLKIDPVKQEMLKLVGTWRVVENITAGDALDDDELKDYPIVTIKMVDKGLEYTWEGSGASGKIVRVDPGSKPKEIDFVLTDADGKDVREFGIYEVAGDTYRDCIAPGGKVRPKTFESTEANGFALMKYKRVKE